MAKQEYFHKHSFNLILMTVRDTPTARDIILTALNPQVDLSGFRFTVAYGGSNQAHLDWIHQQSHRAKDLGGELIVIHQENVRDRLRDAICLDKEWTSFISDDDPFSTNMIRSLVRSTSASPADVGAVAPSVHLGFSGASYLTRKIVEIRGSTSSDRLLQLLDVPDQIGVLFYGAHRTESVSSWFSFFDEKKYIPSYCDQLLSCWSAVHGDVVVSDEPSVFLRDESNWIGPEACTHSDSRFYPAPTMVAFHELFWVADMLNLMGRHSNREAVLTVLQPWSAMMLSRCIGNFNHRIAWLGLEASKREILILESIVKTAYWIQAVRSSEDFLEGISKITELARCADAILLN